MGARRSVSASARRSIALVLAFGLVASGTGWAAVVGLERAGAPRRETVLDQLHGVLGEVERAARRTPRSLDVVVVGDSHLMRAGGLPLHAQVERALWKRVGDAAVWRVAAYGLSLFGHYCLAERIAASEPDRVVVELNLADLSRTWREASQASLAGLVEPARLAPALGLPLGWAGVSLDQLLFYGAVLRTGGLPRWRWLQGEQSRVALGYWALARALQQRSPWPDGMRFVREHEIAGARRARVAGLRRASAEWTRAVLGPALAGAAPDQPALRFLDAVLAHYAVRGIPALVFVNPVNLEHLRALGLDTAGLARTVAAARVVAQRHGADFLDLHALLPDAAFRDEMDHLDPEGEGPARVGAAIAEALLPSR